MSTSNIEAGLTMEIYKEFALNQLERLDAVIHPDVLINSPAGRDIVGREALKGWLTAFIASFRPRIDLIDHYAAGDRALVTVNLHWKHDARRSSASSRLARAERQSRAFSSD